MDTKYQMSIIKNNVDTKYGDKSMTSRIKENVFHCTFLKNPNMFIKLLGNIKTENVKKTKCRH